jgi:hypothetical protein
MKTLLRQLVLTSLVGAVAVVVIDGRIALAGPSPKANAVKIIKKKVIPAVAGKAKQEISKIKDLYEHSTKPTGATRRRLETEAEGEAAVKAKTTEAQAARRQQTETQHELSSLYQGMESDNDLIKRIQHIMETQQRIESKVSAAQKEIEKMAAKVASIEVKKPDAKYGFDAQTGNVTKT